MVNFLGGVSNTGTTGPVGPQGEPGATGGTPDLTELNSKTQNLTSTAVQTKIAGGYVKVGSNATTTRVGMQLEVDNAE